MIVAGIICEYNPFHLGHLRHIEETRRIIGENCAIVCVMSGNFVQRGDFAVFSKHSRAETAVKSGADLVIELPAPYVLSSAEGFASAGVYLLDKLGICDYISFGSEAGDIEALKIAAAGISTPDAEALTKEWLAKGLSYAAARQKAADSTLGSYAMLFETPNNLLGIEYLKAITSLNSALTPITVKRIGDAHDSEYGQSGSALRKTLLIGGAPWSDMPMSAADVYKKEIETGRGPISINSAELAILSRLRAADDDVFCKLSGASEGLEHRFIKHAAVAPTVSAMLNGIKTKRYAMSRLRRMMLCACLGIAAADVTAPPPYIRVLAMNGVGMTLLKYAKNSDVPIITKPAAAQSLPPRAAKMFRLESAATDFYALAYPNENMRFGGQEWLISPCIVKD